MLTVTNKLLEGVMPDVRDVLVVRQAIRNNYNLYQPLDLGKQIKGANMDVSGRCTLVQAHCPDAAGHCS